MAFDQIRLQKLRKYSHTGPELFDFDLYSQKANADQFLARLESGNRMRMVILGTDTLTSESISKYTENIVFILR